VGQGAERRSAEEEEDDDDDDDDVKTVEFLLFRQEGKLKRTGDQEIRICVPPQNA
jgi:hypothetical protein